VDADAAACNSRYDQLDDGDFYRAGVAEADDNHSTAAQLELLQISLSTKIYFDVNVRVFPHNLVSFFAVFASFGWKSRIHSVVRRHVAQQLYV